MYVVSAIVSSDCIIVVARVCVSSVSPSCLIVYVRVASSTVWRFPILFPGTGECYSGRGRGYDGTANTTMDGRDCQRWVSGEPHQFILPPSQYVELEGGHNYCRNPGARGQMPWCFTTDNDTRWEYCSVEQCGGW